ncbi:hypothetical protein Agub_g14039 [Astrephomene gubernaculifera]|uniref:Uncharacterized protein n=1 Tax=Astrephomene gubernaculifera TaxID=47775 RepID=A0AAD3E183_9CHLO|nr:hypothetical protein Agub_g14039 [Astrephomene gubernaculifera]
MSGMLQHRVLSNANATTSAGRPFCRTAFGCIPPASRHRRQGCLARHGRQISVAVRAEKKEYYDYKDMPPLPLTVSRIYIPKLDYTVVSKQNEGMRMASLAIFYDIYKDEQYKSRLTRKSAMTALCMYDRDDVQEAQNTPGDYPNIDLLFRVYSQGMDLEFVVEEFMPQ